MKKIIFTLLLLLSSAFAKVEYTDMFDAYDEAQAQHKQVIVVLTQKGCPGCEYMEDTVFTEKDVNEYMSKSFITVHLDIHQEYVPEELEHFATPTFYFLDADENILKRVNGGEKPQEFLKTLKEVHAKNRG